MQTVTITLAFILLSIAAHLPGPRHRAEAITQARAQIDTLEQSLIYLDSMEAQMDSTFAKYEFKGEWYWDKKEQAARLREQAMEEIRGLERVVGELEVD
jgi:hypothetical protein